MQRFIYAIFSLTLVFSTKLAAFEEVDTKTGAVTATEAAPGVIVEQSEDAAPEKPAYLSDELLFQSSQSRPRQAPSASISLGLEERGFDSRLGVRFDLRAPLYVEPWIAYDKRKTQASDEFFLYSGGADLILQKIFARSFAPFAAAGLGYASWNLADVTRGNTAIAHYKVGMMFQFSKYFGLQINRHTTYYLEEKPSESRDEIARSGSKMRTEVGFFAKI